MGDLKKEEISKELINKYNEVFEFLQQTLEKPLPPMDGEWIIKWFEDGHSKERIKQATVYSVGKNRGYLRYIDAVLNSSKQDNGEFLDKMFSNEKVDELSDIIQAIEGIQNRPITMQEKNMVIKWIEDGFTKEEILKAMYVNYKNKQSISYTYVNSILDSWRKRGMSKQTTDSIEERFKKAGVEILSDNRDDDEEDDANQELLPCPFCGNDDIFLNFAYSPKYNKYFVSYKCSLCDTSGSPIIVDMEKYLHLDTETKNKLVGKWNRRNSL